MYQDVFHGGVTAGGFSTGQGIGSGVVQLHIEPGSVIRKAFLLAYSANIQEDSVIINNETFSFNQINCIESFQITNIYFSPLHLHCIDITQWLQNNLTDNFSVTTIYQAGLPFKGVFAPFIWIAYENTSLPIVGTTLITNTQSLTGNEYYAINDLNVVDLTKPVGFSVYTDRTGSENVPNIKVFFNNNLLGILEGPDANSNIWPWSGTKGHFYYQNHQLFGLDDDTPDAFMGGGDGLADVSNYMTSNNSCDFRLLNILYPMQNMGASSGNLAYTLAYSTPCQPFDVAVSNDTVVCPGEAVQLHASGGVQYEWLPHKNLSCYNCANPVFTGDSSQFYSVRIWNNDSCSVVRPVMVRVRPKPTFSNLSSSPSVCGGSTGSIVAVSPSASNYSLDNTAWQASGSFSNLQAGNYTVYVTDTNGCVGDSTLSVTEQTTVHAQFTATPSTGTVPLSVVLNNQSTNYTHLEWFVDGVSQGANFSEFLAGQSGVYDIELVAWQNNSTCADTFALQISAYDSLLISIPNIVTPNQDGINDLFSIHCNQPVNVTYSILNRWGNVISEGKLNKQQGNVVLWNISDEITDGVYFYKITFSSENPQIQQQLEQLGAVKNGFVEVVR